MTPPSFARASRALPSLAAALTVSLAALAALAGPGCTRNARSDLDTGPGASPDANIPPGVDAGECFGGTRCDGASYQRCVAGVWTTEASCEAGSVCRPDMGCVDASPCNLAIVDRSHLGCEYYAVDLPQPRFSSWPIPLGFPWRAQFGVAVSNPNPEAVRVVVEQNDAAPGEPERRSVVMEANVAGNSVELLRLPRREVNGVSSDDSSPSAASRSAITNHAYRVTSSLPIVAYQFNPIANEGIYSDDASLLVPTHSLDESYVAIGWPGVNNASSPIPSDNRPFLTITATVAGTRVRVIPSIPIQAGERVSARAAGVPLQVGLDRFGVLNLQGDDAGMGAGSLLDFTGTIIEADHPIIVWSGVEAMVINPPGQGYGNADHLEEQLSPRSALGREYVVVRSRPRRPSRVGPPEEDYFKILATVDGTSVTTSLDGADASFTLGRGEARTIFTAESFTVQASEPVVVAQFLLSGGAIDPEERDPFTGEVTHEGQMIGDPSFMTVPPAAQLRSEYRFLVPEGYERDYAIIAAPEGAVIEEDGRAVSCTRAPIGELLGTRWEALHCELDDGAHHFSSDQPFSLIIEGWGPDVVSYGYTGGMDFEPINEECSEDTACPGGEFCSGGYCVPDIDLI